MVASRWALAIAVVVLGLAGAASAISSRTIVSAGPLDEVVLGADLSCTVHRTGDTYYEFYEYLEAPGDCGTFTLIDGALYAPDFSDRTSATSAIGTYTTYTYVNQSVVRGAGTAASPYSVETRARLGLTGVTILQNDSYIVGLDRYLTNITYTNTGATSHTMRLWRAGDCYLQDSDLSYGFADPATGRVACSKNPDDTPHARLEMWVPHTPGSHYYEENYYTVWSRIGAHLAFPDTCVCTSYVDSGAGLSWDFTLAPGASLSFAHDTVFSLRLGPTVTGSVDASRVTCEDSHVVFNASGTDPTGSPLTFTWDFGDGLTGPGPNTVHTYAAPGDYVATVTVTNADGDSSFARIRFHSVGDPNCCPDLDPVPDLTTTEGKTVSFLAVTRDFENDPILFAIQVGPTTARMQSGGAFAWKTVVGDAGDHTVTFTASDASCTRTDTFIVHVRPTTVEPPGPDSDQDGVADSADDCPATPDRFQRDADDDGQGDACDPTPCPAGQAWDADANGCAQGNQGANVVTPRPASDADHDGIADVVDDCPAVANAGQADADGDGIGDVCDADADGDGAVETARAGFVADNCPGLANPDQRDTDGDGVGDACSLKGASPNQVPMRQQVSDLTSSSQGMGGAFLWALAGAGGVGVACAAIAIVASRRRQP